MSLIQLKNKNILISGASVAGPALAYWLHRYGFNVTVIEKADRIRKGGYRVDIRGKAVQVAERMELIDTIRKNSTTVNGSSFVNAKGKTTISFDDPDLLGMREPEDAEIMRGDLANILYDATKNKVEYVFDDSIAGIVQTDECVQVNFKNGKPRTFDLLIGADGLHSNVRNLIFGDETAFVKSFGYHFAIFTIRNSFHLNQWEMSGFMKGSIFNIFSLKENDNATALFMFESDVIPSREQGAGEQKRLLLDHYKNSGTFTSQIVEQAEHSPDFYFDSISQVYMDSLSKGRVALLGDAGYCPSPASGQGTSMALVGAYILAGELAAASGDYQRAFNSYQQEMGDYINLNRKLGSDGLKQIFPKSGLQVWLQMSFMWLLFNSPFKRKLIKKFYQKIQQKVNEAANGITLKGYYQLDACEKNMEFENQ